MALLDNILGGRNSRMPPGMGMGMQRSGMSPMMMALMGALLYRKFKGSGGLGSMLGSRQTADPADPAGTAAPVSGGDLIGGLQDLLERFKQRGHGDKAESWVKTGPNKGIEPVELEEALGEERINWLAKQTSMSREELLAGLSAELPKAVDKLTPDGHIPTEQEAQRLI